MKKESVATPEKNMPFRQAYESIVDKFDNRRHLTGRATGFTNLDQYLSGLQNGDLLLITGDPSVGKTVFASNVACHTLPSENPAVIYFTLEMSSARLAKRMMIAMGRLNCLDIDSGGVKDDDWGVITRTIKSIVDKNIYVMDEFNSIMDMIGYSRLLNEKQKVGLVVIDSLQLAQEFMDDSIDMSDLSRMMAKLKLLARELDAPVMILSGPIYLKNKKTSSQCDNYALIPHIDVHLNISKDDSNVNDDESLFVTTIDIVRARNAGPWCISLLFSRESIRFDNLINDNEMAQGHYND